MNFRLIVFGIVTGFLLWGCSTTYVSGSSIIPTGGEVEYYIKVDTTKTLQGYSETKKFLGFTTKQDKVFSDAYGKRKGEKEKMAATYKALEGSGYDIIVNPKYIIKIKKGFLTKTISVTVAGYGGKYIIKGRE